MNKSRVIPEREINKGQKAMKGSSGHEERMKTTVDKTARGQDCPPRHRELNSIRREPRRIKIKNINRNIELSAKSEYYQRNLIYR